MTISPKLTSISKLKAFTAITLSSVQYKMNSTKLQNPRRYGGAHSA